MPTDHMKKWKDLGKTPEGLRRHSEWIYHRRATEAYSMEVLESAAVEMERLIEANSVLQRQVNESKQAVLI
jgi:hypothetical protein